MKKVMVIMGGLSSEREVSLVSGKGATEALKKCGYEVYPFDFKNGYELFEELKRVKPDVVFNALHGNFGEDGCIQGFLDVLQIPYTHSDVNASAIGMNKQATKEIAVSLGINVAQSQTMTFAKFKQKGTRIDLPYVLKPVSDGSSVGVFIIKDDKDLVGVNYKNENLEILVEKFIAGKELTCAVIDGKSYVVTELRAKEDFYNYEAKYTNGMTEHILPAPIPDDIAETIKTFSQRIHQALNCNTVSRSDFRYNEEDGVVFLEINTNPGLTPLSLVPEQAKYIGISYEELCKKLVENATCKNIPQS